MAGLVNMQQTEYEQTLENLKSFHKEELAEIRNIIKDIQDLSEIDGGFYVEKISAKIKDLLECADQSVLTVLEESFEITEKTMDKLMETVVNIDMV